MSPILRCARPDPIVRFAVLLMSLGLLALPSGAYGGAEEEAEKGAQALALPLEGEGYMFRADSYVNDLEADVGKAVRVQLFKGNEYKFCVAVPPDSGVRIDGTVLDFKGKPGGTVQVLEDGWGLILTYEPSKTGVYAVAGRQTEEGKQKKAPVAIITGYK